MQQACTETHIRCTAGVLEVRIHMLKHEYGKAPKESNIIRLITGKTAIGR